MDLFATADQALRAVLDYDESQHPRDADGKWTSGDGGIDVGGHTPLDKLPASQQAAIGEHADGLGWPSEQAMADKALTMFNESKNVDTFPYTGRHTTAYDEGLGWYGRASKQLDDMRQNLKDGNGNPLPELSMEKATGMAAAIASNCPWEAGGKGTPTSYPNLEMTERVARVLAEDPVVTIRPEDAAYWKGEQGNLFSYAEFKDTRNSPNAPPGYAVKGTEDISQWIGDHHLSELPSDVVARIGNGWMRSELFSGSGGTTGWPNLTLAVQIWRGEGVGDGKTVDEALGGNKIRSFYNAMLEGGANAQDTVIDRWMGRALTGDTHFKPDQLNTPARYKTNPDWVTNAGSYPLFATAVDDAAAKAGIESSDMQAIDWYVVQAKIAAGQTP